jgi:iron complex transport system substrate-binding protein
MTSMRFLVSCCGAAVVAVLLTGATGLAQDRGPIIDATGARIVVNNRSAVVSVGGSVTEILYKLGLSDRIVAVDSTSLFPAGARDLPNVGYMRQLAAEPILGMAPTLVLAVADSGPPSVLDQLREAGLQVVVVPDEPTAQGISNKILLIAQAMDVPQKGRMLSQEIADDLDRLKRAVAAVDTRPRVLFLLSVGSGGAPRAAGRNTSASGIIELAGGVNAIVAFEGYKTLSPEALIEAAPDVLLVTSRSLALLGGPEVLTQIPEISQTPAGRNHRVVAMDGLLLLGFGPRTPMAIELLAGQLHPNFAKVTAAQ